LVGFHGRASDTIIKITDCTVLVPQIVSFLPELERLTTLLGSRKGVLRFAITATDAGLDLDVTGAKEIDAQLQMTLGAVPVARLTVAGEPIALHQPPVIHIDGIAVTPPPAGFLQATQHGEHVLIEAVREALGASAHVVDLFSGCGTFALPLARKAEVHAVEGDAALIQALNGAWRNAQLKAVTTETRDLFRNPLIPEQLARFDAAVIDPPRAGAEAKIAELAKSGIARIAMVSCNPVTFARDAKTLTQAGFALNWIDIVDQFRWSPHIELVGSFSR
jgi:23S rRNA (uracil1939-C5)-methyltransferase